jgi:pyruvate,water dikinase
MGPQNRSVAHRLLHGAETKTVESNRALDILAAAAAEHEAIAAAVASSRGAVELRAALSAARDGRAWLGGLDRYLQAFGYRPGGFDLVYPTWIEDPSFVIQNLRARLRSKGTGASRWYEQNARLDAERDSMLEEVRGRLSAEPDRLARFDRTYDDAQRLWPLKEDHSHYIDQASTAMVRIALAEVGRRLVRSGTIDREEDVWFLTLDDARAALARPLRLAAAVEQRRADRERWARLRPPKHLGTYPAGYDGERSDPEEPAAPGDLRELRGTPASPGDAAGPAVVVMSPADFGKVRPGDVLVCRSTAPMWTPLFGVVAALVSEAGGILSHPAVVAREFGLPAVVGVRSATSLIRDGQTVTVSGGAGLVQLGD